MDFDTLYNQLPEAAKRAFDERRITSFRDLQDFTDVEISLWLGVGKYSFKKIRVARSEWTTSPKVILSKWVEAFNKQNPDELAELYHEDATNHQVANAPVVGKQNIRKMFAEEFSAAKMVCIVENIFEDGEWVILEWRDAACSEANPGLRGCGFFHIVGGKIIFQRGYWDKLSFLNQRTTYTNSR